VVKNRACRVALLFDCFGNSTSAFLPSKHTQISALTPRLFLDLLTNNQLRLRVTELKNKKGETTRSPPRKGNAGNAHERPGAILANSFVLRVLK
jgi:hypothetical protein